jgi:hypothetical protein
LDIVSNLLTPSSLISLTAIVVFDNFVDVLGELEYSQAIMANQRPLIDVVTDGKDVETIHKGIADHIFVQGKLKSGAVMSISVSNYRRFGVT